MRGDDVHYGGWHYGDHEFSGALNEFRFLSNPEAINCFFKGLYAHVKVCNNMIRKYQHEDATSEERQLAAEARVLRAYDYFLLANNWGRPPFIDENTPDDALLTNCEMTHEELIRWVASECEEAEPNLSDRRGVTDKEGAYRVTRGFAQALAGKAYLFVEDYAEARRALKKVIDSGNYALVPGEHFMDLFHVEGDGCEEKIFEFDIHYEADRSAWSGPDDYLLGYVQLSTWMESNCFNWRADAMVMNPISSYTGNVGGWGSLGVQSWFGEAFQANDGNSYRRRASIINIEDAMYLTEEGRTLGMRYNIDYYNNMTPEELASSSFIGISDVLDGLYGQSFWLPLKNIIRASDTNDGGTWGTDNLRLNNYLVMRYAEVLLNYAECCLMTGDNAEAKVYINMIQERAGSQTISSEVDMEVLKREKSFELFYEGSRFFDLIRWNDAAGIERLKNAGSNEPHLFDKLFRSPQSDDRQVTWQHGSESNSRFYTIFTSEAKDAGYEVGFKSGVHEYLPYPESILEANPGLCQNPGF